MAFSAAVVAILGIVALFVYATRDDNSLFAEESTGAAPVASPFAYPFDKTETLHEAGSMEESRSPYWWLGSGGMLITRGELAETIQGELAPVDKWRRLYAASNPVDTDNGQHPQNLFRIISRSRWENVRVEGAFYVANDNWSPSPNRNASNALLIMSRYLNKQNVYYAGIRVDGLAVIKKKRDGIYHILAERRVFPGTYVAGSRTNLLPHGEWIALRLDTITEADGSVRITLSMSRPVDAGWEELLVAHDTGAAGGPPFTGKGFIGFRTDFMDVRFTDWKISTL